MILLHAFEAPFENKLRFAGVAEDAIRRQRVTAQQEALASLRQIAADTAGLGAHWRPLALHGDAAPLILEQEEELGADLIVLGPVLIQSARCVAAQCGWPHEARRRQWPFPWRAERQSGRRIGRQPEGTG
ncbi:MAG: universal stress protein, partial [Gammaproteobacteria bacterium]|nr:universal stress protein [Gammaproteobacteria bacterium]MBU1647653.1 universal stress protein [Gammaproteobacteria bacterium]MBU1973508.1 universal stress protein [Gammaproteobacteria bacterium]